MENNENKKTGIVLNRMYTGSYLSTNLGHEVINMFQADNVNNEPGRHYLYLNAKGNYAKKHDEQISDMLLVRYAGNNKVQVLGWAKGLEAVPGAVDAYQGYDENCNILKKQREYITKNKIKYGGVGLIELFMGSNQQNIYITYSAKEFYRPQKSIYIQYVNESDLLYKDDNVSITNVEKQLNLKLSGYQFGKATLKQYIYPNEHKNGLFKFDRRKKSDEYKQNFNASQVHSEEQFISNLEDRVNKKREKDWKKLVELLDINFKIEDGKPLWVMDEENKKTVEKEGLYDFVSELRDVSLFDIMPKLQRDENCFSDALMYFMNRDKNEWQKILEKLCNKYNIGAICSIEREKDATIGKNKEDEDKKGGRIDLLIRTENAYIVIENKIKSDINSKKDDENGKNQLDRYRDYVTYRIIGDHISQLSDENEKKKKLHQKYDEITAKDFSEKENELEELVREAYKEKKERPDIKAYFFILAPDYNMPEADELKGYLPLYYSALVGIEKDKNKKEVVALMKKYRNSHEKENLWSAFYDAMKRHSYDYENDSLYEDMKNTFFSRINKLNSKISDNHD